MLLGQRGNMAAKIGVFDSGVGGQSVAKAIKKALPDAEVIVREDKKNLPYGNKTPEELLDLVLPILNMLSKEVDVIVVACNTVSTTLINRLREKISIPLIAMEPMVKPAAEQTKTKVITVCATPTTLASERYKWLKNEYAKDVKVLEPD
jgi:glutamate racemase